MNCSKPPKKDEMGLKFQPRLCEAGAQPSAALHSPPQPSAALRSPPQPHHRMWATSHPAVVDLGIPTALAFAALLSPPFVPFTLRCSVYNVRALSVTPKASASFTHMSSTSQGQMQPVGNTPSQALSQSSMGVNHHHV